MKNKICIFLSCLLLAVSLTGCGAVSDIKQFKEDVKSFCDKVSELDTSINRIDASDADAAADVLGYLDQLDEAFQDFSALDFPKTFDALEKLADEASEHMSKAVRGYHDAYENGQFDREMADEAKESSSEALKIIQDILDFLKSGKQ